MSALEWSIYKEWFGWLVEAYTKKPSGFIYLRTTPDVCYTRIQKRSRCEESSIPLSYLEALHSRHEEWLINKHDVLPSLVNVPVLILDCTKEFETDSAARAIMLQQVEQFIASVQNRHNNESPLLHTPMQNAEQNSPKMLI
jgi:deoxyadenosine/deoxycytidine kinase